MPRIEITASTTLKLSPGRYAELRVIDTGSGIAIEASGGREGLRLFELHASEIALVVLDMGMPDLNGAEVFRALRAKSAVKMLIVTGYAMEEEVQDLVAKGARVMEKPFKAQQLEVEVDRALRRSKPQKSVV